MKIRLIGDGFEATLREPFAGADHAVADCACPKCQADPLKVAGTGRHASADDRAWEADGVALCCRERIGLIRAEPSTIFGVREDQAVLSGRARVY